MWINWNNLTFLQKEGLCLTQWGWWCKNNPNYQYIIATSIFFFCKFFHQGCPPDCTLWEVKYTSTTISKLLFRISNTFYTKLRLVFCINIHPLKKQLSQDLLLSLYMWS